MNNQTEPTVAQLSAAWATVGPAFATGLDRAVKAEIERERVLITHPHDGHGPNATCLDCIRNG